MATEPVPENYATEREYAQAWAAFKNLEGARRLASLNLSSDDSQNRGTVNAAADSSSDVNVTNQNFSRQRSTPAMSESGIDSPGLRQTNVLSDFSSYNYALSLYMVSTEAMTDFINSGGKLSSTRNDVFVVAQSAGVNNVAEKRLITKSKQLGPGQQGYDYYIDDLSMMTVLPGNTVSGSTMSFDLKFKIYEPLGFNFLQDLFQMSEKLNQISKATAGRGSFGQFDQNYIIGIKFYGYDVNGNVVKASDTRFARYLNGTSDPNSVAERYLPIRFTSFTYSIDEKSTTYSIEAMISAEYLGQGAINGTVKSNTSLTGTTVEDMLVGQSGRGIKGLIDILNEKALDAKDKKNVQIPTTYKIEFLDENGKLDSNSPIAKARIPTNNDISRSTTPMAQAKTIDNVTVSKSITAQTNDVTKQNSTFGAGKSIIKIIEDIIFASSYITDSLNTKNNQSTEPDAKKNKTTAPFKNFSINTITKPGPKDPITNFVSVEIIYQIRPSEVTFVRSQYVERTTPYKGPFKYYEYIFTGKNTEILKYEQKYDNQYFVERSTSESNNTTTVLNTRDTGVPVISQGRTSGDKVGVSLNGGSDITELVRTNLFSIADQTQVSMKIMGDPDYIMTSVGVDQKNVGTSNSKYYASDLSFNPFSTQLLVEIKFYSPEDYTDKGLLDAKGIVQFYRTSAPLKAGITGIVYRLTQIESTFSRGVFTQTLDKMILIPETALVGGQAPTTQDRETQSQISSGTNGAGDTRTSLDQEDADIGRAIQQQSLGGGFTEEGGTDVVSPYSLAPASPNDDKNLTPVPRTIPEVSARVEEQNFDFTGIRGITQIIAP